MPAPEPPLQKGVIIAGQQWRGDNAPFSWPRAAILRYSVGIHAARYLERWGVLLNELGEGTGVCVRSLQKALDAYAHFAGGWAV